MVDDLPALPPKLRKPRLRRSESCEYLAAVHLSLIHI